MQTVTIPTEQGEFTAVYSEHGLARLEFPGTRRLDRNSATGPSKVTESKLRRWSATTAAALEQILDGKKPASLPPFDWSGGTEFQRCVWAELLRIGPGRTKSYSEIATALRNPGAARAVGSACGANPIPVLVPCHRVLAAGGRLGGFSGGLDWKRRLLSRENVTPK